jgi:hypothetical protein
MIKLLWGRLVINTAHINGKGRDVDLLIIKHTRKRLYKDSPQLVKSIITSLLIIRRVPHFQENDCTCRNFEPSGRFGMKSEKVAPGNFFPAPFSYCFSSSQSFP